MLRPDYLQKYYISFLLLLFLPIASFFIDAKLQWVLTLALLFTLIIESNKIFKTKYFNWILLILIPTIWSFLFSLNGDYYNIVQSLFYLLTPFILLITGVQLGGVMANKYDLYKYVVYSGTAGAITYISIGVFEIGSNAFSDLFMIRRLLLWASISNVMAIIILIFYRKDNVLIFQEKWKNNALLIINALALILTASRTYYLIFLIFLMLVFYVYQKKVLLILMTLLIFLFSIILSIKTDNLMIVKIQNSLSEISVSDEFSGYDDVYAFYRAYETKQALKIFNQSSNVEVLLGNGLNKMVDLEYFVELAGSDRRFIQILHNGYMYLLIRTGIFGILFYALFFLKSILIGIQLKKDNFIAILFIGVLFSLIISNYVISTFFSQEMYFAWLFMGVCYNFASRKIII